MDLLQILVSLVPWAGKKLEGGECGQQWCLGLNSRSIWSGRGRKVEGCKRTPFSLPFSLPPSSQPSGFRVEPGTVATDPRVRVVQQEHKESEKGEQVLISPSPFFFHYLPTGLV